MYTSFTLCQKIITVSSGLLCKFIVIFLMQLQGTNQCIQSNHIAKHKCTCVAQLISFHLHFDWLCNKYLCVKVSPIELM